MSIVLAAIKSRLEGLDKGLSSLLKEIEAKKRKEPSLDNLCQLVRLQTKMEVLSLAQRVLENSRTETRAFKTILFDVSCSLDYAVRNTQEGIIEEEKRLAKIQALSEIMRQLTDWFRSV